MGNSGDRGIGGSGNRALARTDRRLSDAPLARSIRKDSGEKTPARSDRAGEVWGETSGRCNPNDQRGEFAGPDDPDPTPHAAPINREQESLRPVAGDTAATRTEDARAQAAGPQIKQSVRRNVKRFIGPRHPRA